MGGQSGGSLRPRQGGGKGPEKRRSAFGENNDHRGTFDKQS